MREPSRPLTAAEERIDWQGHLAHITERRRAVERYASGAVRRLALGVVELRSLPRARVDEVADRLTRSLKATARFGYTEARHEITAMRGGSAAGPPRAYAVPDAGRYGEAAREGLEGIYRLLARRGEYSAWIIGGAIEGAAEAARLAGADEVIVAESALTAGAKGLHLHVLELVGETLNLGRTAGALSFPEPPKYAMRSEQLDKSTCEACDRIHGELVELDSPDYYAILPPAYCFGGGRCRGVMVFADGVSDVRMPAPNPETKPAPKKRAA